MAPRKHSATGPTYARKTRSQNHIAINRARRYEDDFPAEPRPATRSRSRRKRTASPKEPSPKPKKTTAQKRRPKAQLTVAGVAKVTKSRKKSGAKEWRGTKK
ncbi:hypothetical protein K432DRAFT_405709 [Lepidopterella palustris CBS 459.81]|uniref:Uncharacterized protein n=1 Tax=Lepidopterella palustris CBS 459.81 TaxID=1314670 RepID=A0A8E2JED6_9PEZI|nr:hypothetical protein K432DRAFT_405709 [Lepidopterella palustris CBS 459.81]